MPKLPSRATVEVEEHGLEEAARRARAAQVQAFRDNAEKRARIRVEREIGLEPAEFFYRADTGIGVPLFKHDELIIAAPGGAAMMIVEPCGECDGTPRLWGFTDLAGLGEMLEERADATAHVCQSCTAEIQRVPSGEGL